jgi:glycosyltransferase involved in cell wall biosynthesis
LKVLISSFSCRPGAGSEFAVGWHWPVEAARENEVWVLTPKSAEAAIQDYLATNPVPNLNFAYHPVPAENRAFSYARGFHPALYAIYLAWQLTAVRAARRLHEKLDFDVAQHITWASHRFPSLLAWTTMPFIWGPIGGGERAPRRVYSSLGARAAFGELARDASNLATAIDPMLRHTARRAATILTTSEETRRLLPSNLQDRARVYPAIGLETADLDGLAGPADYGRTQAPRLLFVGRLASWKGCGLAIRALARLRQRGLRARLTVLGDGPEEGKLEQLAASLGVADAVDFHGRVSRQETLRQYGEHDVFLFPSLHDSGGIAVLEAMYLGLPVVCLDLGGPALAVGDAGIRVSVHDLRQVVDDLAEAVAELSRNGDLRQWLAREARRRVLDLYSWDRKGEFIRDLYPATVGRTSLASRADVA